MRVGSLTAEVEGVQLIQSSALCPWLVALTMEVMILDRRQVGRPTASASMSCLGKTYSWLKYEWIGKIREGPSYQHTPGQSWRCDQEERCKKNQQKAKATTKLKMTWTLMCSPPHTHLHWQNTWLDVFEHNFCPVIGWPLDLCSQKIKSKK